MPDTEGPEKKEKREFMREKIVKRPLSRRQIARRIAALAGLAVLFGAVSAVSFTAVRPLAERYLDPQETGASDPIQFTQDEPETAASEAEPETDPAAGQVEEEQLEEAVSQALEDYRFTPENVYAIGNALREVGARADKGIVTVSSGRQQTDFFGNPVEDGPCLFRALDGKRRQPQGLKAQHAVPVAHHGDAVARCHIPPPPQQ